MKADNSSDTSPSHKNESDDAKTAEMPTLNKDLDLQRAVDTLDAASQRLTLRTRTLTTQQTLLAPVSTTSGHLTRTTGNGPKGSRIHSQSQNIRLLNEAKRDELVNIINNMQGVVDRDAGIFPTAISERLRADDRLFELLEQDTKGQSIQLDLSELSIRAQQLSEILHAKYTHSLKDRLDRIYLQAVPEAPTNNIDPAEATEAIPELKRDIQSLYTEINDVVAMSIGQAHMNKVLRVLAEVRHEQQQRRTRSLQHVRSESSTSCTC